MNRKWLTVVVLGCMLAAAALPPVAMAGVGARLSCGLSFDSARDSTECWWRHIWSIPAAGGDATLLIAAYAENRWFTLEELEGVSLALSDVHAGEYQPGDKLKEEDLTLSPGAQVIVKIFDQADPSHVLFSFEGTLAELMALSGGQTVLGGRYGAVVRVPLSVPAGNVLWVGRMEVTQGGYRCHADVFLVQGIPFFFRID